MPGKGVALEQVILREYGAVVTRTYKSLGSGLGVLVVREYIWLYCLS